MKKLVRVMMSALLVATMIPTVVFADSGEMQLTMNEAEAATFIAETLVEGLEVYAAEAEEIKMVSVGNGSEYCRQVYELGDGSQLIMEFEDGVDGLTTFIETGEVPAIRPMATNGETMWKAYGNRYFTAKATVVTDVGSVSLSLENHYLLSEDGIDERYGVTDYETSSISMNGSVEVEGVYITDSSARTVGASDVNMYAAYNILSTGGGIGTTSKTVNLSTTVGYVDHDYDAGQIQVKHSWTKS